METTEDGKKVKKVYPTECVYTHYTGQSRALRMFAKEELKLSNMDIMTDEQLEQEVYKEGYIPMTISGHGCGDEEVILVRKEAVIGSPVLQR